MLRTKSICSSVVVTAASPASVTGTNTDQNCAPTLPCASRGRSVWVKLTGAAMSVCAASAWRSCQARSLWPSISGKRASSAVASSRWLVTGLAYAAHIIASLAGRRAGGGPARLALGEVGGGGLAGVGGAAQETGEQFEFGVCVPGADLVQRGVHPGVEPVQVGAALAQQPDRDRAAV